MTLLCAAAGPMLGCDGDASGTNGGNGGGGGQGGGGQGGASGCPDFAPASLGFSVTGPDGVERGCAESLADEITFEGVVASASSTDAWVIDTCSPNADCMASLAKVNVAGGLKLDIPAGALVRVTFSVESLGGVCSESILITNLPTWSGLTNPVAADEAPWLDVNGSGASPFTVEFIEQCHIDGGENGCDETFYKLRFALKEDASVATAPIGIGESATWSVPSGAAKGTYSVRNLMADSGYCEIPGHTLSWVRREP